MRARARLDDYNVESSNWFDSGRNFLNGLYVFYGGGAIHGCEALERWSKHTASEEKKRRINTAVQNAKVEVLRPRTLNANKKNDLRPVAG